LKLENIVCQNARSGVEICGDKKMPIDGIVFRNVSVGTLMNSLSAIEGAYNVDLAGLTFGQRGNVTNYWDHVMPFMPEPTVKGAAKPKYESHWKGKKVAFLGDSITDARHVGCTANYWDYLASSLGIDAYVYGKNGNRMSGVFLQAEKLLLDLHWYVDAIFVFAGTNDYNANVPRGEWYEVVQETTERSTGRVTLPRRRFSMDKDTFRGRINRVMKLLKEKFPDQQIVLMTAIHRGFATFGPKSFQPEESFPNLLGHHIDDYNDDIREAGRIWSVPVIDLYAESGLMPLVNSHQRYFANPDTDMLHPNSRGQQRIACTMLYKMLSMPSDFKLNDGLFDL
jgi:lysophospholipase L1-like esterase